MKFSPICLPLTLLGLAVSLAACSTAANRRELYNTTSANGPWHDYERRLDASSQTGVAPGDMGHTAGEADLPAPPAPGGSNTGGTTVVRGNRATRQPKSDPIAPDQTTLPSNAPAPAAPAGVPSPTGVPSSPTAPDPAAPASPTSTDPASPAPATNAPAADPSSVPVNPPTT